MKKENKIIMNIVEKIKLFFSKGHERTLKAKKNILAIFIIKFLTIFSNMALVPITLNYLNPTKYGIWITLSSIVGWFTLFDIGLGNGFKNRFAEAVAGGDNNSAKEYVSTTYVLIGIISLIILILVLFINPHLNWARILNAPTELNNELTILALIVFSFFCIRLIVKLIGTILIAEQKPSYERLLKLIGSLLSLLIVFLLTKLSEENLIYLGTAISASPVIVLIFASFILFSNKYKNIRPSINNVNFVHTRKLMGLGIKFFIIQITGIIIYQSANIIISHLFGPAEVAPYNIAYKYFNIINLIMGIILTPYWVAFTDAYTVKDISWIRNTVKKLNMTWLALTLFGLVMLLTSNFIFKIWIGNTVKIPFLLSLVMFLHFTIFSYGAIYIMFLNGTGKIKLQMYFGFFASILYVPLAIILTKYFNFGITGIVVAMIIVNIYGPIIAPIQYRRIIAGKSKGILNK
jgi:O-antigen/teichoic acid export membrane protein